MLFGKKIYIYQNIQLILNGRQLRTILDGAVATSRGYLDHVNQTNIDLVN